MTTLLDFTSEYIAKAHGDDTLHRVLQQSSPKAVAAAVVVSRLQPSA